MQSATSVAIPPFSAAEFRDRQIQAGYAAADRGLVGLLVWARGGSTQDSYADVYWLTGFYNQIPLMPDGPGWSGYGYCAAVVDTSGITTVYANAVTYDSSQVEADLFLAGAPTADLVGSLAIALRALPEGPIGILGGRAIPHDIYSRLQAESGRTLVDAAGLGAELRVIKSLAEQERFRASCALASRAVDAIMSAAAPGRTEAEAVSKGMEILVAGGGVLYGMGVSSGENAHTYGPSTPAPYDWLRPLREGDMFRIDFYGSVHGYSFDFGRTRTVGAAPTTEQRQIMDAARLSVQAGIDAVRPGATFSDVAEACRAALAATAWAATGRGRPPAMGDVWGHSIGSAVEEPWITASSEIVIEAGMCLAIERRIIDPEFGGATFEENLVVTETGADVVTTSDPWTY